MKKTLQNPSADKRPVSSEYFDPKDIMKLGYEKAITALVDYDGPIRSLLERIISTEPQYAHILMDDWRKEAKAIMNVVYKLNGLKQRWTEV